ncbi:MAG: hypothetical protein Ct9H300mP19_17070 [Dehalococcoidia bacterium]|nr:MAG: hypothetical protein Ct9H300mP19_17070 [Dehalococcoidia bacterium]
MTEEAKWDAIAQRISELHRDGRPVWLEQRVSINRNYLQAY